jgi:peroxiredoxin
MRALYGLVVLKMMLAASAGSGESPAAKPWAPVEGSSLLGSAAPEWKGIDWIQGEPTTLAALRGKVVLLRFWLIGCSYCSRTAPGLRDLSQRYKDRGLVVVGLHHPKSDAARDPDAVRRAVRSLRLDFPIGTDNEWQTVRAYGVGTVFERFTSVSFVIDRRGVIRFVHDGGEFHEGGGPEHADCQAAYQAVENAVVLSLKADE